MINDAKLLYYKVTQSSVFSQHVLTYISNKNCELTVYNGTVLNFFWVLNVKLIT